MTHICNASAKLESHKELLLQARLSEQEKNKLTRRCQLQELFHLLNVRDTSGVLHFSTDADFTSQQDGRECSVFVETYGQGSIMKLEDWETHYLSPVASPNLDVLQTRSRATRAVADEVAKLEAEEQMDIDVYEPEDRVESEETMNQMSISLQSSAHVASVPSMDQAGMEELDDHTVSTAESNEAGSFQIEASQPEPLSHVEVLEQRLDTDTVEREAVPAEELSKDELDVISVPTSAHSSPSPQARRRISISRKSVNPSFSPSSSEVVSPSESPPTRNLPPRTRSMSLAARFSAPPLPPLHASHSLTRSPSPPQQIHSLPQTQPKSSSSLEPSALLRLDQESEGEDISKLGAGNQEENVGPTELKSHEPYLQQTGFAEVKILDTLVSSSDFDYPAPEQSESPTRSRSESISISLEAPVAGSDSVETTRARMASEAAEKPGTSVESESKLAELSPSAASQTHSISMAEEGGQDYPSPFTGSRAQSVPISETGTPLVADGNEIAVNTHPEETGVPVHEFKVEEEERTTRVKVEDEEASEMRMEESMSPLSRAPTLSPVPSLSPAPPLPDEPASAFDAPGVEMDYSLQVESPARSPPQVGSSVWQRQLELGSPALVKIEGQESNVASNEEGEDNIRPPSLSTVQARSPTRSPSVPVQQFLQPPQSNAISHLGDVRSPRTLAYTRPPPPSLVLPKLPSQLPKRTDFPFIFASTVEALQGQKVKQNEEESTLLVANSSFYPPLNANFPDTTPSSSSLLAPYSTFLPLPSVEELPSTFSRKVHPAKLMRRREREREKEERERKGRVKDKDKDVKDDGKEKEKKDGKEGTKSGWIPWEIGRWGAQFRANPAHKLVKRSGKVMTTRMWGVALHELQLMRALERIEKLKQEGRWSFRQPKKQKCPVVAKSHLDWLLDEMKWMRADYREERRWKIAVAFELAHEVRAWHLATTAERKSLCTRSARKATRAAQESPMEVEMGLGFPEEESSASTKRAAVDPSIPDHGYSASKLTLTESKELDPEREAEIIWTQQRQERKEAEVVALNEEQIDLVNEAGDDDAEGEADADGEMEVDDGEGVIGVTDIGVTDVDDAQLASPEHAQTKGDAEDGSVPDADLKDGGLKDNSLNPTLTSDPEKLPGATTLATTPVDKLKRHLRDSLAYIPDDATFLDMDTLCSEISDLSTVDPFMPPQMPDIFPELPTFCPLVASPSETEAIVISKSDKKSEKKDKKSMEELIRTDDAANLKVVSTSTFMNYRPALVSALQPAKRWRGDTWVGFDDPVVATDDTSVLEPISSGIFSNPKARTPGIQALSPSIRMPKDPQKRFNETPWSTSEDQILKHVVERYPNNWSLVADTFNSARVTISTDRRTAWDCLARWDTRWNDGRILMPSNAPTTPGSVAEGNVTEPAGFSSSIPPTPAMGLMTRKRSSSQLSPMNPGQQAESRKRRRHNHMHEAMRKSAKKRETNLKQIATQNKRAPNSQVHETHAAYNKPNNRTPAELSRIKAERDRREYEEYQQRKKQEEDMLRKHRTQMELMKQQAEATRRAQAAGQSAVGQPAVSVPIVRTPGHPQVNISQQPPRLPANVTALSGANLAVPTIGQNMGIPGPMQGMNMNMQTFQRLSPQQQQAIYAQMQARQAQMQAQAHSQSQQQSQSAGTTAGPASVAAMPNTQGGHPQASPAATQTSPHHPTQAQVSPPGHGVPTGGVGMVNMASSGLMRPGPSQQPRATSSQAHHNTGPAPALHHALLQNQHAAGLSQDQMKRLYQNQLYWTQQPGNAQAQPHVAGHMAYPGISQQQRHSPSRPVSAQANPSSTPAPPPAGS